MSRLSDLYPYVVPIQVTILTEKGDILYSSAANTPAALHHGAARDLLRSGGHNADPFFEATNLIGPDLHTATAKNPPIDEDEVVFLDSVGGTWNLVKATWTQVKAFLKTYLDGLYALIISPIFTGTVTVGTPAVAGNVNIVTKLGAELAPVITNALWTPGVGWTINDGLGTATRVASAVTTMVPTTPIVPSITKDYMVEFTISGWTAGYITCTLGGVVSTLHAGNQAVHLHYSPYTTGNLIFTPDATFAGVITLVSVKEMSDGVIDVHNAINFHDSRGHPRRLAHMAWHLSEEQMDTLLDKSRSALTCVGGVLTYTLYAIFGKETFNFNGIVYPDEVNSASVVLTGNTDLAPVINYVYFRLVGNTPTMTASAIYPTEVHIDVATFIIGAVAGVNYTSYAYSRNRYEVESFVKRVIQRFEENGTLYLDGFLPTVTAATLSIAVGNFLNGIFKMTTANVVTVAGGFFYINAAGQYVQCTLLSELNVYTDGTALGANERQNIVWGVVPTTTTFGGILPVTVRLVACLQTKPTSVYINDATARQDVYDATNYYPPVAALKNVFVPVCRTIVRPSASAFSIFDTGIYYKDCRGKITSGGGAPASVPTVGILDGNIVGIDSATVTDNEYARFTANGLESRSAAEVLTDIDAVAGDGTVNPANNVVNGNFEVWTLPAAPDGWTLNGAGASVSKEVGAGLFKIGLASAKLTRVTNNCNIYQDVHTEKGINWWKGKWFIFSCWVYATVNNRAYISFGDGVGSIDSAYHTGNSTWQKLIIGTQIDAAATYIRIYCSLANGDTSVYFDGAMFVEGVSEFSFSDKPSDVRLDNLSTPEDNTDLNANTTNHGLLLKATAPGAGLMNFVGLANGETAYLNKPLFDVTNPASLGAVNPGTQVIAARRDHVHALPALLSDGDKGDITVGGTGTTLTIEAEAVTYAKIQHVSAEQKVLGRISAGAGDVEEVTIGIVDNNIVQIDSADFTDNEYARFTATGLESRTVAEVRMDLASGTVKECGDADYTILDNDGYNTFIFRELTADRLLNLPTLSANQGREITAIVDNVNLWVLTLDVAPATDWAAGDVITGQTSTYTSVIVKRVSALVYIVKNYSYNWYQQYWLNEVIGVTGTAAKLADQGAANPIVTQCAAYKVTITHEGTDIINGFHPGDIDLNRAFGWWKLTGTATEWKAITDGNSTVYETIANTSLTLDSTRYIWADAPGMVLSNLPCGKYELEAMASLRANCGTITMSLWMALGIGTLSGDNGPDIIFAEHGYGGLANHTYDIYGTLHPVAHDYINLDATVDLYLKTRVESVEAITYFITQWNKGDSATGTDEYICYIRARRLA